MAFNSRIITSVLGRRLGLQRMSSNETGSARAPAEFLVGPDDFRVGVTTAETTAVNVKAFGISVLPGTTAASSAVYTLEPPIPGVRKVLMGGTANGPVYIKTLNSETILTTSLGSSFTTIKFSSLGSAIELIGLTTAIWLTQASSGTVVTTST